MSTKSLIASTRVVDLLNRLNHSPNYSTIEELETKLPFEATKEKRLTPNMMSLNPANKIGIAFDNFDKYVETVSGKDTSHNIVGIAYETSSIQLEGISTF